jgi:regulator of protease activity HflC (stomatin/prohibitin superfamily)
VLASLSIASIVGLAVAAAVVVAVIAALASATFAVEQQTRAIVERFGRFVRVEHPGLKFKRPFVEQVAATVSLRVEQLAILIETKTKDNVFVHVRVAVQYKVNDDDQKVADSHYLLNDPEVQMEAYSYDVVRAKIPMMDLDTAYADVEEVAAAIERTLRDQMARYGYDVVKALVTNIEPAEAVKQAMNNINASRRNREAALAQGEADKTLAVKRAEADAESKRLQGEGIAAERKAIMEGLKESVEELTAATGVSAGKAMEIILVTNWTDMLRDVARASDTNTIFLPQSPSGLSDTLAALAANGVAFDRPGSTP